MRRVRTIMVCGMLVVAGGLIANAQEKNASVKVHVLSNLESIKSRVMEMANDFPEGKLDYRPAPNVRTFGEILLHIAGTNYYYIRTAMGKDLGPEDPKRSEYPTRKAISDFLEKSFTVTTQQIDAESESVALQHLAVWIEAVMHVNEHYGNLVVYYRLNGIVPPTSRN